MDEGNGDDPVTFRLCAESRAHMETKIDGMKSSIQWSIYLATTGMGLLAMVFNWYIQVVVNG